jgi:hypothetical protein
MCFVIAIAKDSVCAFISADLERICSVTVLAPKV